MRNVRLIIIFLFTHIWVQLSGQINLVPNPGFEILSTCDLNFGTANFAEPWMIDDPLATPDLFHACSTNPNFQLPSGRGCFPIFPKSGDGMVGLAQIGQVEERVFAWLLDTLPRDVDIYVACDVITRAKCGTPNETLCYTNSQALAFADIRFTSTTILELENILEVFDSWTKLETCYSATGEEEIVQIGNYKDLTELRGDCDIFDDFTFAYFYVDDVIVAPFDILPDTVILCGDETYIIDTSFYEVPLEWNDGVQSGNRILENEGFYEIYGLLDTCELTDRVQVIRVEDIDGNFEVNQCSGEPTALRTPLRALWSTGELSKTIEVTQPGLYEAEILADCDTILWTFEVIEGPCIVTSFAPNIFSPDDNGMNDEAVFRFEADFPFFR